MDLILVKIPGNVVSRKKSNKSGASSSNQSIESKVVFDQYSRIRACADLLSGLVEGQAEEGKPSVLDVGCGEEFLLSEFLPELDWTFVDPLLAEAAKDDSRLIGDTIFATELDSRQFDYALAIDVLEHIPAADRDRFLERMLQLATKALILAFPCEDAGEAAETDKVVDEKYRAFAENSYPWLKEHYDYGLPSLVEVKSFYESKGKKVTVIPHGHVPWLKSLLSLTVCAWDIPEMREGVLAVSRRFNQNLFAYDFAPPHYRQIVVVTDAAQDVQIPEALPPGEAQEREVAEMIEQFAFEVTKAIPAVVSGQEDLRQEAQLLRKRAEERDEEITRLQGLLEQQSTWGEESAASVKQRDEEIARLNKLVAELSEWGQKATEDIKIRDRDVLRLKAELEKRSVDLEKLGAELEKLQEELRLNVGNE